MIKNDTSVSPFAFLSTNESEVRVFDLPSVRGPEINRTPKSRLLEWI